MTDILRVLLFESLPLLLVAEGIVLAAVIAVHRRRLTARTRRAIWVTLGLCVLMPIMQSLVVTDHEALDALVHGLARSVSQGDIAAIGARVDEAFHGGRKREFLDMLNERLQERKVET